MGSKLLFNIITFHLNIQVLTRLVFVIFIVVIQYSFRDYSSLLHEALSACVRVIESVVESDSVS
jgi:hypothetical protein